ncbi:hypothetical protein CWI39_0215p0020 [Hamiltosporidium magnivora]|uniref:Uncharacterized protein n=1 Tax=Hamiltosporidium magnivora TaxID=148818 RepID=A0A4V6MVI1_9MICR|nr:hypothetical protein CWI39_0215p0020 [Hamiltosporidium magnivora]
MPFWKTKIFKILVLIFAAQIIVWLILGSIGYNKACGAIKKFEEDYKKVSETDKFKEHLSKTKNTKKAFFLILEGGNYNSGTLEITNNINLETIEKASSASDLFVFEPSDFTKILPNVGFLTRIGFIFKQNHPIVAIYKACKIFEEELNQHTKDKERSFVVLEMIDDKKINIYKLHMKNTENKFRGRMIDLTFASAKINDKICVVSDYITYIV